MKTLFIRLSLLCSISLFLNACCTKREPKHSKELLVQPAPLQDAKTDSLKNYLDDERARRKLQGKE